jgi:hypothetical protein
MLRRYKGTVELSHPEKRLFGRNLNVADVSNAFARPFTAPAR